MKAPTDLAGYDPHATADGCKWDGDAARRAVEFFPKFCRHIKGPLANQPYELNPWERDFVATLIGWKRPDGTRRYREAFVGIPRKNSKTTLCAGLSLYLLFADNEDGAEVYCAASTRDQATMVFNPAAAMVRANKALARRATVVDSKKNIAYAERNSYMRAVAAEAGPLHGTHTHAAIIDEVHTQPNRDLYDVFKTSVVNREQPLVIGITTAGHDRDSICYELWSYARQIRDGLVQDPHFLPVLYEAEESDDWTDPKVWAKVNPNYGRSVKIEYLEEAFNRARTTPAFENTFKNLHLNIWTEAESRWMTTEAWEACEGEFPDLAGADTWCGLDLASTDDITAFVKVHRLDGQLFVVPHFYVPEETVRAARKTYQSQYRDWVSKGLLTVTPGSATDYGFVRQQILDDARKYRVKCIAFDAWQALDTFQQLDDAGLPCLKVSQSYAGLHPGVKATEEAVLEQRLVHDGNQVLRWMLACTVVDHDGNGNRKPSKRKSHGDTGTKGKIDGVSALVMAMGQVSETPEAEPFVTLLS